MMCAAIVIFVASARVQAEGSQVRVDRAKPMSLERFQRDVVRSRLMISQGRQWLQIPCLDVPDPAR